MKTLKGADIHSTNFVTTIFGVCWCWGFMATVYQPKWIVVIYS